MKKLFFMLAFMLMGISSFATTDLEVNSSDMDMLLGPCTISTTRDIPDANGDRHTVTVTNTGDDCYQAWKKNQDELEGFENGIKPAQ